MRQQRIAATMLVLGLLASACGARLTDEQRAAALGAGPATAGDAAAPVTPTGPTSPTGPAAPTTSGPATTDTTTDTTSDTTTDDTADPVDTTTDTTTDSGSTDTPDAGPAEPGPATEAPNPAVPTDTRAMPPGGNGGATDIGVNETEVYIGNISDVSGAVPGLFEAAQLAGKAYVAYHNAAYQTIYGRALRYLPYDAGMDAGRNRSASIEACENAFTDVGSISPLDQGAAPVIDECNIPDIRVSATTPQMKAVDNAYSMSPAVDRVESMGQHQYFADNHPDAIKRAAYLYIAGEVTEKSTQQTRDAQATIGYEYVYLQPVDLTETNYAPFVLELIDRDVKYVAFQGAYQQGVRLAEAMRQQGYVPEVYRLQSNAYVADYIELGGAAVENTFFTLNTVLIEEAAQYPELQTYLQWLEQVAPGKDPSPQGILAWSAGMLFHEIATAIGPNLTREAVLEQVAQVEGWDGNGLHPPFNIGAREPSDCYVAVQVRDGAFTRVFPDQDFACGDGVADLR